MSSESGIEWTDSTWNPVVGCKAVSPGCDHCYAARDASGRLRNVPVYAGLAVDGAFTGEVRMLADRLEEPWRWREPRRIFVNSMSDLFHPAVTDEFIKSVFYVMATSPRHQFQVLTKRPARMAAWTARHYDGRAPLPNVWLGTSVESWVYRWRIDHLRQCPAALRFLSIEPLLGPLPSLALTGIDWVIVGGESGPGARRMDPDWVREVQEWCGLFEVPLFVKQMGSVLGRELGCADNKGGDVAAWPEEFRVQEMPA